MAGGSATACGCGPRAAWRWCVVASPACSAGLLRRCSPRLLPGPSPLAALTSDLRFRRCRARERWIRRRRRLPGPVRPYWETLRALPPGRLLSPRRHHLPPPPEASKRLPEASAEASGVQVERGDGGEWRQWCGDDSVSCVIHDPVAFAAEFFPKFPELECTFLYLF